jgi:outer membrane protein
MKIATVIKATTLGVIVATASPSFATTLTDALIQAYQTNPSLRVGRSGLRATDETVRQAKGALEPTISTGASFDKLDGTSPLTNTTPTTGVFIQASIPIYAGGTLLNAVDQARYNVLASRQSLIATEQQVLLDAVTAYMDVRRDIRNVELGVNSVRVLSEEVRAANERFEVGEVTRTDVAQAESRLAASESDLQTTRANLKRSINFYILTIGSKPKNLNIPPSTPKLPATTDAAEAVAIARHPNILLRQFNVKAAEKGLKIARGGVLPTISANASVTRNNNNSNSTGPTVSDRQTTSAIGLDLTQPIYQGGRLNSNQRQALALLEQSNAELQLSGLQVRENVKSTYAIWEASKASITARRKQVSAAQIAFDGASEEAKLGARTTLDVLNSEQDLLQAQNDLVAAIRDEYVSAYGVLAAMGLLTVEHLGLGVESYNPDVNYQAVSGANKFGAQRQKIMDKLKILNGE